MKVSKEQKEATRAKLLKAAVDVICRKGYQDASMREIARAAEVGDATIYSYFPAKGKLLYAYFEDRISAALTEARSAPDFSSYSFQEKLQAFIESHLGLLLADREFVDEAVRLAFVTPLGRFSEAATARALLVEAVEEFMEEAIASGHFERPPMHAMVAGMFWEYYLGIVIYWLQDTSDEYANTSQLVDSSLNLLQSVLNSDVLARLSDLFFFFVRNHMYGALELLGQTMANKPGPAASEGGRSSGD